MYLSVQCSKTKKCSFLCNVENIVLYIFKYNTIILKYSTVNFLKGRYELRL